MKTKGTERGRVTLDGHEYIVETTEMMVSAQRLREEAGIQIVRYGPRGGRHVAFSIHPNDISELTVALREASAHLGAFVYLYENGSARCPTCGLDLADDNDTTHECPPGFKDDPVQP